jgi:hypothetical protein
MAAFAAVVFVSAIFFPLFSDDAAANPVMVSINVSGKVIAESGNEGFGDIEIYLNEELTNNTVNADGEFSIITDVEEGDYTIRLKRGGYAVKSYIYDGKDKDAWGDQILELNTSSYRTFMLHVILLKASGTVEGTVKYDGSPIGGIRIEVYEDSDLCYTTTTGRDGTYSLSLPAGGTYHITVNARNFTAESDTVVISGVQHPYVVNFELVPKQDSVYLFGFDLTHSLMVIGGILGLFMLIFVVLYRIHIAKNPELSRIHSDSLERKKYQK